LLSFFFLWMDREYIEKHLAEYRRALFENVIPFWLEHSPDREHGGYFTCLDREGNVFDTDKFVWLQAREVWMFSKLYNEVKHIEGQDEATLAQTKRLWLETAKLGADFLRKHGADKDGNFYFSLTRDGQPIIAPYNIFSDFFACLAFSQYAKASGEEWARTLTAQIFHTIERRKHNPKGHWNKCVEGTRPFQGLAFPMIDINLCSEILELKDNHSDFDVGLSADQIQARMDAHLRSIFPTFLDPVRGLLHENVSEKPEARDTFEGRLINPGHSIECLWFMMAAAKRQGDTALINKAAEVMLTTLEFGWDKEFGGFFYFLDIDGKPPQQLEWDQKLWWVHVEALVALSQAYLLTDRQEFAHWYKKVHEWTWEHFADREHGEWFGYLNRRGEVLLNLKGGKWKGCFHVPRAMYLCAQIFEKLLEKAKTEA
jgi:N-acylglucosamine 2-epimerase